MKRALSTLALLSLLGMAAFAQVTATNGSVTLTPIYGSTAFVPGAAISATGRNFHDGTQGYQDPLGLRNRFTVTAQPGNVPCHIVQVEPSRLWFFLPFSAPVGMTSITISLRDPFATTLGTGPLVWTEVVPLTVQVTAPAIRAEGRWRTFRDPQDHPFNGGVLVFPRSVGIIAVALFGNNFGNLNDWVIRVQGNGVNFELLSYMEPLSPVYSTPYLYFQLPQVAPGAYTLTAYPLLDSGIVSNAVVLLVE